MRLEGPLGCATVTNFNDPPSRLIRIRSRAGLGLAVLGAATLIAGCGSSDSSSSSIGVGVQNKSDEALATTGKTTPTTPTSGALATEPKVTPPSGPAPTKLVTKDLIVGTGPEAKPGDTVTANYVGVLYKGGKVFDASWKRKEPLSFIIGKGQVIPGWDKGFAGMKVGGRRELIIPAPLAYGAQGQPPSVPPNATLVFVVDLLGV
jgi:peptidylprolyl isomerase